MVDQPCGPRTLEARRRLDPPHTSCGPAGVEVSRQEPRPALDHGPYPLRLHVLDQTHKGVADVEVRPVAQYVGDLEEHGPVPATPTRQQSGPGPGRSVSAGTRLTPGSSGPSGAPRGPWVISTVSGADPLSWDIECLWGHGGWGVHWVTWETGGSRLPADATQDCPEIVPHPPTRTCAPRRPARGSVRLGVRVPGPRDRRLAPIPGVCGDWTHSPVQRPVDHHRHLDEGGVLEQGAVPDGNRRVVGPPVVQPARVRVLLDHLVRQPLVPARREQVAL